MSKRKSKKDLWEGLALPVIKKVPSTLVASHLVSVTPMAAPTGMIYVPYIPMYITEPTAELHIPTPEEIEAQTIAEIENKIKEEIGLPVYRVPVSEESQLWEEPPGIRITSIPVSSATRKMKATWSTTLAEDLSHYSSIDAEAELTTLLNEHLNEEMKKMDKEIVEKLFELSKPKIGVSSRYAEKKINSKYYKKIEIKKEP